MVQRKVIKPDFSPVPSRLSLAVFIVDMCCCVLESDLETCAWRFTYIDLIVCLSCFGVLFSCSLTIRCLGIYWLSMNESVICDASVGVGRDVDVVH